MPHTMKEVMSPAALTIGSTLPLKKAQSLMQEHDLRHLPVLEHGKVVGVLSDRDIRFAATVDKLDALTVEEAMTDTPYVVGQTDALPAVCAHMAEHKFGCAIIQEGEGTVVGIFTITDALKFIANHCK